MYVSSVNIFGFLPHFSFIVIYVDVICEEQWNIENVSLFFFFPAPTGDYGQTARWEGAHGGGVER